MMVEADDVRFDAAVGAVEEEVKVYDSHDELSLQKTLEIAAVLPLKSHRYERDVEVTQEDCELINFDITLNQTTQLHPIIDTTMRPE
jgi:hypothetical protein